MNRERRTDSILAKLDSQRFISMIAKDPADDKEAANLKAQGFIEVHPLPEWIPYLADFANKFYVDENGVMKAPGNLPVTALQKAFANVKQQLQASNESVASLKSTEADLVKQIGAISDDNKALTKDAEQSKEAAEKSSKLVSGIMVQLFQLKAQLSAKK